MSMHTCVVSIEGNHLDQVGEVLEKHGYVIEKTSTATTGKKASRELAWRPEPNRVAKVAYFANGWTFLLDPELVLFADDIWADYSRKWKARILSCICEGTSGTFGIAMRKSGKEIRKVVSVDGEVVVDEGKALPEESGVDWSAVTEEDVFEIAKRTGAEYDFLPNREYTIFYLHGSQSGEEE